jgi:capsular exopolysaccharide synthesis family protein
VSAGGGAESNVLRYYVGVVRRRWIWIVLGVLVGLAAGWASTLLIKEERDPNQYFKATNTLVVNGVGGTTQNAPNLSQVAFMTRSAELVEKLATELSISTQQVNDQLTANARSDVLAIDVTAISTDPNQAVRLADAAAAELTTLMANQAQADFTAQRDDVMAKLDDLKEQRAELEAVINLDPDNADMQRAEMDSVINQYRLVYEELQALSTSGGPSGGLSTLQSATPVQINAGAYATRLAENRNARGAIGSATVTTLQGDLAETDLSVGPPVSKPMRILIGGAAGLVMGFAMAFLVEAWDDRIRKRERVESLTALPVIAEVPRLPKETPQNDIVVVDAPRSRAAERYRSVRTAVLFALHEHLGVGPKGTEPGIKWSGTRAPVLMVTSPNPSEGKTTTVANLAAAFADGGMRTLVIDCDYRKPSIAKYLAPRPNLDSDATLSETRIDGVSFIPAPRGAGSPGAAVGLLRDTIEHWRDTVDIVLLDTPPMLTTNDATDLLAAADAVVLVLRAGQTRSGQAERVANVLARYRADALGVVLNSCDDADIDAYYGYYRGYTDDAPSAEPKRRLGRNRDAAGEPVAPTAP